MDNHTTAYDILTDLEGRLEKPKRTGDKLVARCPSHQDKTPSLSVTIGDSGDRVVMYCFAGCTTDAVLDTLGLEMRDLFATDDAWRSHTTFEWTDPATGQVVTQTRHYTGKSKYLVEPGQKTGTLFYPARHDPDATRPIVWCEGAKAAKAAALKLPADDFDVVGFFSASTIPSPDTLKTVATGRAHIVWPDYDLPGEDVARRLVSALRQAGADDVVTVDPALLGLTAGRHDDAAEWHPQDSPGDELRAACVAAKPEEASPVPMDEAEQVRFWAEELKNEDLDGKRRILRTIKAAPVWQQLAVDMRLEVVEGLSKPTDKSIATVIIGRYDDRKMAWCDPPGKVEDTSEPGFKLVWDIEAQPDPRAVVPGLLYEGHQTVIEAGPKWGKTTLLIDAVASAYASGEWLGESCDEPGPILWISEMAEPLIRAWLARRLPEGVQPDIYVSPICSLNKLAAAVEEIHPSAVIVDSFIAAFRAERPNAGKPDEWRAGDVREFFTRLRDICPTSLTTNHVRKSDGAGRDSGDLHAAVDLIIELRDEDSKRHYTAPELNDRRRTLHYAGRIIHGRVTHCQMGDDFGFTVVDGHGTPSTGGGGVVDPFTVGEPADPLDAKISGFLMANPGVSQNAVQKAVGGGRPHMVSRLKVVGTLGTDKLWRCANQPGEEAKPSRKDVVLDDGITPPEQVRLEAPPPPVVTRDAVGCVSVCTTNGTQGETHRVHASNPIGDTPSRRTSETHLETHLAVPNLDPLARAKVTTAPPPRGGSGESNFVPQGDEVHSTDRGKQVSPRGTLVSPLPESGKTLPSGGKCFSPSHRSLPAPEVHSSGIKKWDDATSTWVDTLSDDCWMPFLRTVRLGDGLTVTDGDSGVHKPSRWTDDQWSHYEQRGMVH